MVREERKLYRNEDVGCVVENGGSVSDGLWMCRGE
jgi:hypothetical protein